MWEECEESCADCDGCGLIYVDGLNPISILGSSINASPNGVYVDTGLYTTPGGVSDLSDYWATPNNAHKIYKHTFNDPYSAFEQVFFLWWDASDDHWRISIHEPNAPGCQVGDSPETFPTKIEFGRRVPAKECLVGGLIGNNWASQVSRSLTPGQTCPYKSNWGHIVTCLSC